MYVDNQNLNRDSDLISSAQPIKGEVPHGSHWVNLVSDLYRKIQRQQNKFIRMICKKSRIHKDLNVSPVKYAFTPSEHTNM